MKTDETDVSVGTCTVTVTAAENASPAKSTDNQTETPANESNTPAETPTTAAADTLKYEANGGSGSMTATEGTTGSDVTVAKNLFTRENYSFTEWNTKADGTGTTYKEGNTYKLTDSDDILYAQWKSADITIKYLSSDTSKGTVAIGEETIASGTTKANGSTATPKTNYKFTNWTDSNGKIVSYNAKFVPKTLTSATYTANFAENTVSLNYKVNNGGYVTRSRETVGVLTGSAKGATAIASIGYKFVSWTKNGASVSKDLTYVPQKNETTGMYVGTTYQANFVKDNTDYKQIKTTYTSGDSKWKASVSNVKTTTSGIKVELTEENGKYVVVVTIPEDYAGDSIDVDVSDALVKAWLVKNPYTPGDNSDFCSIKIVNNSKNTYNYTDNSMLIRSLESDYNSATCHFLDFESDAETGENAYINMLGFDGTIPEYHCAINRTSNIALLALYGIYTAPEKLTVQQGCDSAISAKLKAIVDSNNKQLYPNGIEDLDQYYLDFYNNYYHESYSKLEDFSDYEIGNNTYGILGGIVIDYNLRETNKQIAELGYNFFYNRLMGVAPSAANINANNFTVGENEVAPYSVGSYMNGTASYNKYCNDAWSSIKSESNATLENMGFYINNLYCSNPYQAFGFDIKVGFSLTKTPDTPVTPPYTPPTPVTTYYNVTVNYYLLNTTTKLADSYTTQGVAGSSYDVTSKDKIDIDGYSYVSTDTTKGALAGTLNENKIINVYYRAKGTQPYTSATLTLTGTKTLSGGTLADKQFTFAVTGTSDNTKDTLAAATAVNAADGKITLPEMTFDAPGTYVYTVSEENDGQSGITYDAGVYTVTVTVEADSNEKLSVKSTVIKKNGKTTDGIAFANKKTSTSSSTTSTTSTTTSTTTTSTTTDSTSTHTATVLGYTTSVKTGDASNVMLYVLLILAATGVMAAVLKKRGLNK